MTLRYPKGLFIGGKWTSSHGGVTAIENPSTGDTIGELQLASEEDVDRAVEAARAALRGPWGKLSAAERGRFLSSISAIVTKHADWLAELEASDVGKPISQARADVRALARYFEFYGGAADKIHGETIPYQAGYTVYTLLEPFGVTGHIIPWNYPMQIIGRSVVAALTMGNAAVLKPAEQASLTSLAVAELLHEAGLPPGVLNVVPGTGPVAGEALAGHRGIDHVSFTGSTGVGAAVQAAASRNAVPVTLELGGKSPQVVFDDADIESALPFLLNAGIQNAGQTCSAGSRIIVQRGVYEEVVDRLGRKFNDLKAGPAMDDHALGPLISNKQQEVVARYLEQGERELKLVGRGSIVEDAPAGGHYVPPSLFADVSGDHRLAQEEVFGPLVVVIPFDSEDDAIELANGTPYGLVAGAWTKDGGRQMRLARSLRAGQVFLNNYGAAGGVELPFGGVGRSGHGREKGMEALYSFSTLKTVAAYHG